MKSTIVLLLLFVLVLTFEIKAQSADSADPFLEAKRAIEESNSIYFTPFKKNDPAIFIERYAANACILSPNAPKLCGPEAARKFFESAYRDYGMRDGKFITIEIYGDGKEFVTEEGVWQSFDGNGKLFDHGKFLVLWKRTDKGWKMFRDSFSSDRPVVRE